MLLASLEFSRDWQDALARAEDSRRLRPDDPVFWEGYQNLQRGVGHDEAAIRATQKALDHAPSGLDQALSLAWRGGPQARLQAYRTEFLGDFQTAAPILEKT